jgi:magnesium-transporting ATPase (P-type)
MVFSGTAVVSGRGRAVVTATGMDTEVGHIARLLGRIVEEPTPLQREVAVIGRTLAVAVVAIAVVVVGAILLTSELDRASDVVDVLLVGVALAVAAVPEGLPAVLSIVLAPGCPTHGPRARHRQEAVVGRDAGFRVGDLLGELRKLAMMWRRGPV